ncbi:MAG: diguanylate cyclase [Syntrophobacterales bacterium]|nr:diguanylate cyclase [Syntrophobacterales bacterium]
MRKNEIDKTYYDQESAQKLRIKRFLLGVLSYVVVWIVVICFWFWGVFRLSLEKTILLILLSVVINTTFYIMLKSGINRRFKDPSLTLPQIGAGIIFATVVIYLSNAYRGILLILYFIALIFGIFRFGRRQFIVTVCCSVLGYGLVILALWRYHPEVIELKFEILQLLVFFFTSIWFAFIGDYISNLRKRMARSYAQLSNAYKKMEQLARRDYLTGVLNRMGIMEFLELEIERSNRYKNSFSICITDIDYFKRINDNFGHAVGDQVLKTFVEILSSCSRKTDIIGRYGGEEFIIVLTETPLEFAKICLNRCRVAVEMEEFPGLPEGYRVTASFGVTEYSLGENLDSLLSRADRALYMAKKSGKNRVVSLTDKSEEDLDKGEILGARGRSL